MFSLEFKELLGQTFDFVTRERIDGNDAIVFRNKSKTYALFHKQECCESVVIEDVCGDLSDLVGEPICKSECSTNGFNASVYEHQTWSFYHFATVNGYVTIRFHGSSNGLYSETADLYEVNDEE